MGPDNEEQLHAHLQTQLKTWSDALLQFKPLAETGKYPGGQVIESGLPMLARLLAETDPFKFLQSFLSRKDDLLDLSDGYQDVSNFYTKQRPLWEELRAGAERFRLNEMELQRDPEAAPALQRVDQILQSASPYKILSEARGLLDKLTEVNSAIVSARRAQALEAVAKQRELALAEIASAGSPDQLAQDFEARYQGLAESCAKQVSVAHLDQAAYEATRLFETALTSLERASAPPPPSPSSTPVKYPKPKLPGPKPRHVVEVASLLRKPFLENAEEVEDFLTRLRTELTNAIARQERIQLK
jgi:hypothetical protein